MRAKVWVSSLKEQGGSEVVNFDAVYTGSKENESFSMATPVLQLEMMIDNPDAMGKFKRGEEYYLDFTKAEGV